MGNPLVSDIHTLSDLFTTGVGVGFFFKIDINFPKQAVVPYLDKHESSQIPRGISDGKQT